MLVKRYLTNIPEENFISLQPEAGVLQALIAKTVEGMKSGNREANWKRLRDLVSEFGLASSDDKKLAIARRICTQVRKGAEFSQQSDRLVEYIELKRKLSEHEQKRARGAEEMMNAREVAALAGALLDAVKARVTDPAVQRGIADEFETIAKARGLVPGDMTYGSA